MSDGFVTVQGLRLFYRREGTGQPLVIQGRYDLSSPDNGEQIRQRIPGARLVTCEKSAHFPFLEEPEYFVDTVQKCLAGTLVL